MIHERARTAILLPGPVNTEEEGISQLPMTVSYG